LNRLWSESGIGRAVRLGLAARIFLAVAVLTAAGCAMVGGESPEAAVRERAQARWDAMVKGDFKAAYGYLSPGSRAVLSEPSYEGSLKKGFWKSARVESVTCRSAEACDVSATIEYDYMGHRLKTPLRESWIRDEGQWWYVKQ
jgi:hypothetical protein